ncbi:MAG: hypothetical protein QW468_03045 [Candidatus Bathyarchaeia archaeon]
MLSAIPVPNPERKRKAIELKGEVPSVIKIPLGYRFHPRCSFAEKICKEREPELITATSGHFVFCY